MKANKGMSNSKIKAENECTASARKVKRVLNRSGMKKMKMKLKPRLFKHHKEARFSFLKSWDNEWNNVLFSDEKKIYLDSSDSLQYYWHGSKIIQDLFSTKASGDGRVMVWEAMSAVGTMNLQVVKGRMNASGYLNMMCNASLKDGERLCAESWVYQ